MDAGKLIWFGELVINIDCMADHQRSSDELSYVARRSVI
jgi:hypothetical protein